MNRKQLKRILRKALNESRASFGNTPVESFKPAELGGMREIIEEIHYIMSELSDGSVRLMDPTDYGDLLSTMQDLVYDGDYEMEEYLDQLTANRQGQYIRIALR